LNTMNTMTIAITKNHWLIKMWNAYTDTHTHHTLFLSHTQTSHTHTTCQWDRSMSCRPTEARVLDTTTSRLWACSCATGCRIRAQGQSRLSSALLDGWAGCLTSLSHLCVLSVSVSLSVCELCVRERERERERIIGGN
jgi:hypothetical protein